MIYLYINGQIFTTEIELAWFEPLSDVPLTEKCKMMAILLPIHDFCSSLVAMSTKNRLNSFGTFEMCFINMSRSRSQYCW